jgi:hypothetical protein
VRRSSKSDPGPGGRRSGQGRLRSGQAGPNGWQSERNVGKGRKEWRHFAEVGGRREVDRDRTGSRAAIRSPNEEVSGS